MSNQSYKELAIPHFKQVFEIVDGIMVKLGIPYYLIGASAIALELLKKGVKPSRGTKDIDFAIMISSLEQYDKLRESLKEFGFNGVKAPWTFYSEEYNVVLDILPFGEIEEQDTLSFTERYTDLHVLGFKEVLSNSVNVRIENKIVNIPPLPGMIILKLVAWSDRPEERENDLTDILRIIEYYFDHNTDEILEKYHDTFTNKEEFDTILISAEVLGHKAKTILDKSDILKERISSVLILNIQEKHKSKIAREWARKKDWEIEYSLMIIEAFYNGALGSI